LTNEIQIIAGKAYLDSEALGPPAKWAAAPPTLPPPDASEE
jgi:hypothetical protein